MDDNKLIRTVALVHIQDGKLLLVRPKAKTAFYMPGGRHDPGESDEAALAREIDEELGCTVHTHTMRPYGVFEDRAYGEPEDVHVRIACYFGELDRSPIPRSEIAEFRYFSHGEYQRMPDTAPAVHRIMSELRDQDLIV